jgi:predicted SnoaL-like aldol condensation-catalyzing enzyme
VNIWRIADGKIADHWGSRDDLGLLNQLGLL